VLSLICQLAQMWIYVKNTATTYDKQKVATKT
jgi:hypothetical protein